MYNAESQIIPITKKCTKCGIYKILTDYGIKSGSKYRLLGKKYIRSYCKSCANVASNKFHKNKVLTDKDYADKSKRLSFIRRQKPEYIAKKKENTQNRWASLTLQQKRDIRNKWKFGLTPEAFNAIYEIQHGKCAICLYFLDREKKRQCFVDHDHITGYVRGILCQHCNTGLGYFRDNEKYLYNAILYIKKSKGIE